jgi:hypothetical protein
LVLRRLPPPAGVFLGKCPCNASMSALHSGSPAVANHLFTRAHTDAAKKTKATMFSCAHQSNVLRSTPLVARTSSLPSLQRNRGARPVRPQYASSSSSRTPYASSSSRTLIPIYGQNMPRQMQERNDVIYSTPERRTGRSASVPPSVHEPCGKCQHGEHSGSTSEITHRQ